jgi:dipeptidyl aminopeptidase/acylaminoacyl peptidase
MSLPDIIPLEVLFGDPEKFGATLSPDGKTISYVAPRDGVKNVWIRSREADDDRPVTRDRGQGIMFHFWSYDGKLLYIQDRDGDENWHLYAVNPDTGEERNLTPFSGVRAEVLDGDPDRPSEVLVALNQRDRRLMDAYVLNLETGELALEAENPGDVDVWVTAKGLRVRGAMAARPGGSFLLRLRRDDGTFEEFAAFGPEDNDSWCAGFTTDGKGVYLVDSRGRNTQRLVEVDLASGAEKEILADPVYDVTTVMFNPRTEALEAVLVMGDRMNWKAYDPDVREVFRTFRERLDGDFMGFRRDLSERFWLVTCMSDDAPVSCHILDRESGEVNLLFYMRSDLLNHRLAKMEPVHFKARDGLDLHGYLTLPPGVEAENLPLVLCVHGGPYFRDYWGYDPEAQWFANRGYACLQVNFRGSSGYGKAFLNAADREWAGKMHDDLIDGVNWAVAQGIADAERLAIYGGSYGGYAALVGATFTPDVFRCAVAMCGPSNLTTFMNTIPPYWETFKEVFYRRIGHPERDAEFLRSRSPLFRVDQIRIPLLIAQGGNDPRVAQAESEQMVEALRKAGRPVEYLLFPDEGHGFIREENRLAFYRAVDRFLAEHLGGRSDEAGS